MLTLRDSPDPCVSLLQCNLLDGPHPRRHVPRERYSNKQPREANERTIENNQFTERGLGAGGDTPPPQYLIQEHNTSSDSPRTHKDHSQPLASEDNVPHVGRYERVQMSREIICWLFLRGGRFLGR
jgi:hypothetical protein